MEIESIDTVGMYISWSTGQNIKKYTQAVELQKKAEKSVSSASNVKTLTYQASIASSNLDKFAGSFGKVIDKISEKV